MNDERMLKVDQVAERLQVNVETVRRWIRQGKVQAVMIGGTKTGYRIPESEVRRLCSGGSATQE